MIVGADRIPTLGTVSHTYLVMHACTQPLACAGTNASERNSSVYVHSHAHSVQLLQKCVQDFMAIPELCSWCFCPADLYSTTATFCDNCYTNDISQYI